MSSGEHCATIGYLWGTRPSRPARFYIGPANIGKIYATRGLIDGFFFNPPLGFEGDNGLWLQADSMEFQQSTALGSFEVNYRCSNPAVTNADLIIGIRYIDLMDQINILTDDDGLTFLPADPRRMAVYEVVVQ